MRDSHAVAIAEHGAEHGAEPGAEHGAEPGGEPGNDHDKEGNKKDKKNKKSLKDKVSTGLKDSPIFGHFDKIFGTKNGIKVIKKPIKK